MSEEPPESYYLAEWQLERLYELASEKAADDPDLGFPAAENPAQIALDGPRTVDGMGYYFTATYQGRSVEVFIDGDIFEPSEPDYGPDEWELL